MRHEQALIVMADSGATGFSFHTEASDGLICNTYNSGTKGCDGEAPSAPVSHPAAPDSELRPPYRGDESAKRNERRRGYIRSAQVSAHLDIRRGGGRKPLQGGGEPMRRSPNAQRRGKLRRINRARSRKSMPLKAPAPALVQAGVTPSASTRRW